MRRGEERRGEEEQATDIKSNNPHLAGGEKGKTYNTAKLHKSTCTSGFTKVYRWVCLHCSN